MRDVYDFCKKYQIVIEKILDFDSGIGNSIRHFKKILSKLYLTCLDVSTESLKLSKELHPEQEDCMHFDGKSLPF